MKAETDATIEEMELRAEALKKRKQLEAAKKLEEENKKKRRRTSFKG